MCVCVCVNIKAFNKCTGRLSVVNLEPIIQSEVSQKETEISYINTCMESRKMVLMNYLQGSLGDKDNRQQICGHRAGKETVRRTKRVALKHIHHHMYR